MYSILATSLVLSLALFCTAALNSCSFATNDISLTEAQLIQIAPQSKSCDDPPAKGECAMAKTAADSISQSFNINKVTNKAEQVAILSLMAFESNDFKYKKNHFPGTLGQGTRNMQSPAFNKKYAKSIPELKSRFYFVENFPPIYLTCCCSKEVRSALQDGSEKGWKNYITECRETNVTHERKEYWDRSAKALGVKDA
ncbi:uncharacterized protein N7506_001887 [Penicillium brevicompactum]|uniref:uncharacterized protein n=1 Tax=Penicillium brevicompactum TaxID=5074 RepID=UPI0025401384|nr:uncharacterized protein N7506_001887 [Penicillium brevicompactum]KAJ5348634.1 hypothetical protein N7506_001887 [Penicillium brevicompactum]